MSGVTNATPGDPTVPTASPGVAHGLTAYAAGCRCDRCIRAAAEYAAHRRRLARYAEARLRAA